MGKTGSAVAMTLIFFAASWLYLIGPIVCTIWALIDVFFINKWLKQNRQAIENKVTQDLLYARNYHPITGQEPVSQGSDSETEQN
ncbi:hypothetical protein KIMC2_11440 [Xylocopilactobacillus apis]|uniref:TM2 domain-containing protein n=1 Tax=Xylocopilactobacillus apis TaxID=2932183 RepID=A0AAU9D737_9LACO|nr:hypothetical protein KIMC2_11440 [Xylocopilactobacillus apis]